MNTFKKAFGRERSVIPKNTKTLAEADIIKDVNNIIYYRTAIDEYYKNELFNALSYVNKAIELDNSNWLFNAFKANVLEETKQYSSAIDEYIKAIEINGNDIYVYALYHQIGWCYLNINNDHKAIEFYTYAIDLELKHPNHEYNKDLEGMDNGVVVGKEMKQMYVNRGNSYKNISNLESAQQDCLEAVKCDDNYSNPYLLLYQIYIKAGLEEKAIGFLQTSARLGNQNAVRMLNEL